MNIIHERRGVLSHMLPLEKLWGGGTSLVLYPLDVEHGALKGAWLFVRHDLTGSIRVVSGH